MGSRLRPCCRGDGQNRAGFPDELSYDTGGCGFCPRRAGYRRRKQCGQHGIKQHGGQPPIRYDALRTCLAKVARKALETNASVHMPRIGCGLAGGKWEAVEPIMGRSLFPRASR